MHDTVVVAPPDTRRPWRTYRRMLVGAGALIAVVAAVVALGWPVYVRPQVDPLRPADAIVVLGGTPYERFDLGLDLARRGYARQLLISRSTGADDPAMDKYCDGHFDFQVSCFVPDPWTTQGEAQEIGRRARQFGWHHIIVVTFTPHVSRARYIVEKCFSGEVTMVASPSPSGLAFWAWMYLRQSGGYLKAFTERGC
ncbi:YdcF family protein [Nocardia suismassiliense]|uniref:YdcF family protein n=1 Tax=Nocardia suismassiliense TaxID=2077092 RepID=UPI000D1E8AB0|nr:YdcF family protein [Nocardia suismassiliense]